METELKNCPFCGGKAELIHDDTTTYGWAVRCESETCIAHEISPAYSQYEGAVEDWNRRVSE